MAGNIILNHPDRKMGATIRKSVLLRIVDDVFPYMFMHHFVILYLVSVCMRFTDLPLYLSAESISRFFHKAVSF